MLARDTQVNRAQTHPGAGVWYPEEKGALTSGTARMRLMQRASQGYEKPCYRFDLNKTLWQIESDPKYLAMGMYF